MTFGPGTAVYSCNHASIVAEGRSVSDAELEAGIDSTVGTILRDVTGTMSLRRLLDGVPATEFAANELERVLQPQTALEDWRVGEAIAEAYLTDNKGCEFPWPSGRDLRNPVASPAGADLVGFRTAKDKTRFVFGEVKTSGEEKWPPGVMVGRSGITKQLEGLRDNASTKDALVKYLGHRAEGASWLNKWKEATRHYLQASTDVELHGVLIRDVDPKAADLDGRAEHLSKTCPTATSIALIALYLPKSSIKNLPALAAKAKKGGRP